MVAIIHGPPGYAARFPSNHFAVRVARLEAAFHIALVLAALHRSGYPQPESGQGRLALA